MTSLQGVTKECEELEATLWEKHLRDNLTIFSFAKSDSSLRYVGIVKGSGAWKPKILESREALSRALLHAKNSRNGSFAIALVEPGSQAENFFAGTLLTEEQAFGSYVQLIEFVDGGPVLYDGKEEPQGGS